MDTSQAVQETDDGGVTVDLDALEPSPTSEGITASNAGAYDEAGTDVAVPDVNLPPQAHESDTYISDEEFSQLPPAAKARLNALYHEQQEAGRNQSSAIEFARTQKSQVDSLQKQLADANKQVNELRSASITQNRSQLLDEFTQAQDVGDSAAQRDLLDKLTQTGAAPVEEIADLEPEPAPMSNQPVASPDVEAWANRNAAWFNPNSPQFDQNKHNLAMEINNYLVQEGADPNHPKFIEKLDQTLTQVLRDQAAQVAEPSENVHNQTTPSSRPPMAQPTLQPARTRQKAKSGKLTLTASEHTVAKQLGLTPQQYAQEVVKMRRS